MLFRYSGIFISHVWHKVLNRHAPSPHKLCHTVRFFSIQIGHGGASGGSHSLTTSPSRWPCQEPLVKYTLSTNPACRGFLGRHCQLVSAVAPRNRRPLLWIRWPRLYHENRVQESTTGPPAIPSRQRQSHYVAENLSLDFIVLDCASRRVERVLRCVRVV